jgi:phosphocarrier protein
MSVGLSGSAGALSRSVTICNQRGLHARAAARFVKLASTFDAEVTVERNGQSVGGQSIMGLMMLAAGIGSEVTIGARGREAEAALEALAELVRRGFDED